MCLLSAHILFLVFRYGLHFFGCWTLLLQTMGTRTALEDIVTCPYRKLFFQKSDDLKFRQKNVFFSWKFWKIRPFSKKYNYGLKRSKIFVGMKYDVYEPSLMFYIVFEMLTWLQYIRHKNFLKVNFLKNCLFFALRKFCAWCTSIMWASQIQYKTLNWIHIHRISCLRRS